MAPDSRMGRWLQSLWYPGDKPSTGTPAAKGWGGMLELALKGALGLISQLYKALMVWRTWAYRQGWLYTAPRLPVPVIVIGNVIAGGAGKTPTCLAVVRHLIQQGWRPGIVSKGYQPQAHKGSQTPLQAVSKDSAAEDVGDEPLLLARRSGVPVMVGHDRTAAAQALLLLHPEINVLLSDDGLQHLRLPRDIEILVFDERGVGNGLHLPAGPLRESAQRPADLLLYNAADPTLVRPGFTSQRRLTHLTPLKPWLQGELQAYAPAAVDLFMTPVVSPSTLAIAGIAHPPRFFDLLRRHGLDFTPMPLADHERLPDEAWADLPAERILITEKDAVKYPHLQDPRVWVVSLQLVPEPGFFQALNTQLNRIAHHG